MAIMDYTIAADGTVEWRDDDNDGDLHRGGGPARVLPSGREEWFRHGRLHRLHGPAVIHANGSVKYYVDGVRHRERGPAGVYVNGPRSGTWKAGAIATTVRRRSTPMGGGSGLSKGEKVREERAPASPR